MSNIKLEERTVVGTVDLTVEDEPLNPNKSLIDLHDKWLNDFQKLANQYKESQLLLEKQNKKKVPISEKESIICLDSDSEEESETISAAKDTETSAEVANKVNNVEDLFADNYPLTNTPLNCDYDMESLDADDENDTTKISPRFFSSNLRTYQPKKSNLLQLDDKSKSGANEPNKSQDLEAEKAYRRDSIHISSTPPEETQDEEDDGTDVQDENDDLFEENNDAQTYTFLPSANKRSEKDQIRRTRPYPTYNNNMLNDNAVFSQSISRYSQHQHNQEKQHYHSDTSEIKVLFLFFIFCILKTKFNARKPLTDAKKTEEKSAI